MSANPIVSLSPKALDPQPDPEKTLSAHQLRHEFGTLMVGLRLDLGWLDQRLADQAGSSADAVHTLRMEMRMRCDEMGEQIDRAMQRLERIVSIHGADGASDGVER
jgi:integrase